VVQYRDYIHDLPLQGRERSKKGVRINMTCDTINEEAKSMGNCRIQYEQDPTSDRGITVSKGVSCVGVKKQAGDWCDE